MVTANWVQSRPNHWGRDTLMIGSRQNVLYIWMYSIYKCYKWGYNEFPKRAEMEQKQNHRLLLSTVLYLNPARGNALKIHSTLQSAPESLIHCKCCKKPVTRDTHALHLTAPSSQQCLRATQEPWYCCCGRNQKKIRTQNTKKKNSPKILCRYFCKLSSSIHCKHTKWLRNISAVCWLYVLLHPLLIALRPTLINSQRVFTILIVKCSRRICPSLRISSHSPSIYY